MTLTRMTRRKKRKTIVGTLVGHDRCNEYEQDLELAVDIKTGVITFEWHTQSPPEPTSPYP
jgi:hypothetical protein